MQEFHLERLEKLADHLLNGKLGHQQFDFAFYNRNFDDGFQSCGTAGCAMGELPIVWPDKFRFSGNSIEDITSPDMGTTSVGKVWFGLNTYQYDNLFMPNFLGIRFSKKELDVLATKEDVAENILAFVKIKREQLNAIQSNEN
jgi:hypothetical protein